MLDVTGPNLPGQPRDQIPFHENKVLRPISERELHYSGCVLISKASAVIITVTLARQKCRSVGKGSDSTLGTNLVVTFCWEMKVTARGLDVKPVSQKKPILLLFLYLQSSWSPWHQMLHSSTRKAAFRLQHKAITQLNLLRLDTMRFHNMKSKLRLSKVDSMWVGNPISWGYYQFALSNAIVEAVPIMQLQN